MGNILPASEPKTKKMTDLSFDIKEIIAPLVLSLFGGIAGYVMKSQHRNILQFVSDMIVSAFAGVLMFFVLENYELSSSWKAVFIALSGCMAREVLIIATNKFMKIFKNIAEDEKKK